MENLREIILKSPFKTQEKFSEATGINEAIVSKYCRRIRKPSKRHAEIIRKMLLEPKDTVKKDG